MGLAVTPGASLSIEDVLRITGEGQAVRSRAAADRPAAVTPHEVVIAGGGPTGLMLAAAELALAGIDVAIVERTDQMVRRRMIGSTLTRVPDRV